MSADLNQPVGVSLVLYPVHRHALWTLRAGAGMTSASSVLRSLIRTVSSETMLAMRQHFAHPEEASGSLGRLTRPSLFLDATDVAQLDHFADAAKAPSRSAVARFLILNAGRTGRPLEGAVR